MTREGTWTGSSVSDIVVDTPKGQVPWGRVGTVGKPTTTRPRKAAPLS